MSYFIRLIIFLALTISTIANAEEKSRTIEGKILGIDRKGIKDVVVFLFEESSPAIGKRNPEIAPAEIVFDEKGFQDQVLIIRQFQNVVIRNKRRPRPPVF